MKIRSIVRWNTNSTQKTVAVTNLREGDARNVAESHALIVMADVKSAAVPFAFSIQYLSIVPMAEFGFVVVATANLCVKID
ncbi:MAG: hypothetical protein HZA50_18395 [Planctomycetes bacterium]|nr:hypothetical protein [Planctomycetota bacterium]